MPKTAPTYLKNATLLIVSDLLLRLAGMAFRIYLANALGDEGMGLYQLVVAFYAVFITLASAGVSVAATRLVAEEFSESAATARGMMRYLLAVAAALGVGAALLQLGFARLAAQYWIGDVRTTAAIQIAAFSLPSMAVASVLRGFFLARRRVQPNVYSQMAEQTVRIGVVLVLLLQSEGASLETRCAIVLFGTALSETVSCAMMAFFYRRETGVQFSNERARAPKHAKRRIWEIVWPVAGGRVLASALHTAENMLVPACLAVYLATAGGRTEAVAQYGVLKGMAMPLLVFPMGLLGSLATLLMPEITEAHVLGKRVQLAHLLNKMFTITMYAAVLGGVAFFLFAQDLGTVLYGSEETGLYLRLLAPMAPFMYLENMVTGALKGLGEQKATFGYSAIDSIVRIVCVVVLLPQFGMWSFLLVICVSNFYTSIMNSRRLLLITSIPLRVRAWLIYPALAALGAVLASKAATALYAQLYAQRVLAAMQNFVDFARLAQLLDMLVGMAALGAVYLAIALPLGLYKALAGGFRAKEKISQTS